MENNTTVIKRSASWFRPYNVDGKELKRICIYKDGEILFSVCRGWLEHNQNDVISLTLNGDIKRATKENLSRKDNYFLKFNDDKAGYFQTGYALYVHSDIKKLDEVLDWEDDNQAHYYTRYELPLSGVIYTLDKQDERGEWQYKNEEVSPIILRAGYRTERKEKGKKIDALSERLKAEGIELSDDQVTTLIEKFNVA